MHQNPGPQKLKNALASDERTLSWLSRRIEVSPSTVLRWINAAARPKEPQRKRLQAMFGIHPDEWGRE